MFDRRKDGLWWDKLLTFVDGCTPCSPGCERCWAARNAHRWKDHKNEQIRARYRGLTDVNGQFTGEIRLRRDAWEVPGKVGKPTVWLVMNDLFHPDVPFPFIRKSLEVMGEAKQHRFLVLTKRTARVLEFCRRYEVGVKPGQVPWPRNVGAGGTVEGQSQAHRIEDVLRFPSRFRWINYGPALEALDLRPYLMLTGENGSQEFHEAHGWSYDEWSGGFCGPIEDDPCYAPGPGLHFVADEGESGAGGRPPDFAWFRKVRDDCAAAGVPYWHKQNGEWDEITDKAPIVHKFRGDRVHTFPSGNSVVRVGKAKAGRLLDGREHLEIPGQWRDMG